MAQVLTPDICIIGAGASGLAVAEAAKRIGGEVVIVEKAEPGGSSLRSGALALRALAAAAGHAASASRAEPFGVFVEPAKIGFRRVHDHIAEVIARSAGDSGAARIAALGIELIKGTGAFADAKTLKAGDAEIRARRFVIATGAHSVVPEVPGLYSVPYFTAETIFDNTRKLTHLVIVGAGPMALELALSYRRLGADVTVVETGRALPFSDPELAEVALRRLRDEGVTMHQESAIVALHSRSQGIGVTIRAGEDMQTLDVSHVLVAAGRTANLDELNLEAARIRRSKSDPGALSLSVSLRTSNPKVFAVGEAAGHSSHINHAEADLVVRAALLGQQVRYEPAAMPRLTLTDPEIAEIGLTEPMARSRMKGGFKIYRASYAENDRARAGREGMGVMKLIVSRSGKILGAGIVGPSAGELLPLFAFAMAQNVNAAKLSELLAPYPSYAELVRSLGEQIAATTPLNRMQARRFALNRLLG